MAIAEVFLSAFLQVLFARLDALVSPYLLTFLRRDKIEKQLRKCKTLLFTIKAVLADAEEKQIAEQTVKQWLAELQDVAYDLDDIVDELTTEAAVRSRSNEENQAGTSTSSLRKVLIPACCTTFTPSIMKFDGKMVSKIDRINDRLESLENHIGLLSLVSNNGREPTTPATAGGHTTSQPPRVYGREAEKLAILNLLLREEQCSSDIQEVRVVPIVGMGGMGKTTLAQLVYSDAKVKAHFDLKAWVCVTNEFDVLRISKAIFHLVTGKNGDSMELESIQVQLKEELSKKKFLLVLDDVWNENYLKWDHLRRLFQVGLPGSTIIVTTRSKIVASTMGGSAAHHNLNELGHHDCMSLLAEHALGTTNFDAQHLELKVFGEEIVHKCKGLPLAVKALGGLLRNKLPKQDWEHVLHSNIWDFPDCDIPQALLLSYYHLTPLLKDLFTYTALFPKDYVFDKDGLVLLWMAQGLLSQPANTREQVEEFGCRCFKDLFDRSFFQSLNNDESKFVMHDLMNDLARKVAGETFLGLEAAGEDYKISEKVRHFSYVPQSYEVSQKYADFYKIQLRLRTFLSLRLDHYESYYLSNKVLHDVLPNLSCLRVISLAYYWITEIPDSIGNLKHLRYLDFSNTAIKCLPNSDSSLYNLQTLLLRGCGYLHRFLSNMENLVNLRHLDITGIWSLKEMPSGIGKLTSLRTLSKFIVSKRGSRGLGLGELGYLPLLRGSLSITGLENVMGVSEAKEANLNNKHGIDELVLQWSKNQNISNNGSVETEVLDNLRPPAELKTLEIDSYCGMKFPSWLGDPSFKQVVEVKLTNCEECTSLPPLGQLPKLKKVEIKGMRGVKSVDAEFYYLDRGVPLESHIFFPLLETLSIVDMPEWEVWSLPVIASDGGSGDAGQFAHLSKLFMKGCPKLVAVPPCLRLPSLVDLIVESCDEAILKSFADLTSLTYLSIGGIKGLRHLVDEEDNLQLLRAPLEKLYVRNCNELLSLGEEEQCLPSNIQTLYIRKCVSLEKLPTRMSSLEELEIDSCPKLMKIPQGLPKLISLIISDCAPLEKLPTMDSLEELCIDSCPKLMKTPQAMLKLRSLTIFDCAALESLPQEMWQLLKLEVENCPCLRLYPTTTNNLETLTISDYNSTLLQDCNMPLLKSLKINEVDNSGGLLSSLSNLSSLTKLDIRECDDLESFPDGGKCLPTNLRCLDISKCWNLKCMPRDIQSLTSLTLLSLSRLSQVDFVEGGLPPNLIILDIWDCQIVKPMSEWGLHRLTSLKMLCISSGYEYPKLLMEPIPPPPTGGIAGAGEERSDINYYFLPLSLTDFTIIGCQNLESLLEGLQNLTSLQRLDIMDYPKLQSLPHKNVLSTLESLHIWGCPLITKCCLKKKKNKDYVGDYWPIIVHIPYVLIDNKRIDEENLEN